MRRFERRAAILGARRSGLPGAAESMIASTVLLPETGAVTSARHDGQGPAIPAWRELAVNVRPQARQSK